MKRKISVTTLYHLTITITKKFLIKQQQQNTKHYHHYHVEILHDDRGHETIDRRLFSTGASCRAPRVAFFLINEAA